MLLETVHCDTHERRPTDCKYKFWEYRQVQNLEQANTHV